MARSLKLAVFRTMYNTINPTNQNVEAIQSGANYLQQLPDLVLDELFLYLCEEKNKLEIPLSATEVALFLHPRKKALLMGEEYGGLVFNLQLLITIARENMLKLTNLELPRGIDISCNAFQQLCATVPNLVILNLSEGKLEIGCLKVLQTLTGLKILNLSGTRLQTGSLKHVSSLCLKELHLNHTKITNAELLDILQPFTKLREHLHSLHIAGTLVTLVGLLPMLSFIPKLEELVTDHSTLDLLLITPPSVLKYLKLNNISSGSGLGSHPATLRQVCFATEALPNLKHIDLLVTDIRQPIFYVLGKWKHLEHLCLYHMFSLAWIVISPALESLNKTLKYLSLFNITGFPHTFPHTMEIKYSFPKLEHLEITEGISESFPVFTIHTEWLIAMISGSPNLVCLRVGGCLGLTDASICKVFTNHTILSLKHITLNSCQNVGNLGLKTLLFKKSLQEISITGMASIFFGDYTSLKNKLKECYNWEIKYMVEKSNVHFVRI